MNIDFSLKVICSDGGCLTFSFFSAFFLSHTAKTEKPDTVCVIVFLVFAEIRARKLLLPCVVHNLVNLTLRIRDTPYIENKQDLLEILT
jgi:hypothetical protein